MTRNGVSVTNRQVRGRAKVPPRWMITAVVLIGVAVDLATLAYIWDLPFSRGLTDNQVQLALAGSILSATLVSLGVALGVVRSRG